MGNALSLLYTHFCKPTTTAGDAGSFGSHGGVSALAHDIFQFELTSQGLYLEFKHSKDAWSEAKPPPKTSEEASKFVIDNLKKHQKADVEGLLAFYGLPLPQTLGQPSANSETSLPQGVKFELRTLPVDVKAIPDGDTITVYVSTTEPWESSNIPKDVRVAAAQRSKACADKNYTKADALQKKITISGYRVLNVRNQEILARKYRIRLRGIDAPESSMPYGKEAKEELVKLVGGKCLRVLVYGEDRYGRCVGDIYCNGKFVQEIMLKKGLAWHYSAYDQRIELATVSNQQILHSCTCFNQNLKKLSNSKCYVLV
ncbi:hypothetical protein GOBAR_DD21527 [Gossypium barbadense]|nr:hypothetical protein GOBAR_DD21527 [Gossypium barbadense]